MSMTDEQRGQQTVDDFVAGHGAPPKTLEELHKVVALALLRKRLSDAPDSASLDVVVRLRAISDDDANMIIANLELLRPILEAHFNEVG